MGLGIKDVKINFWSNTAICEDIGYMIYQPTTTKIQIQIQIQIQLKNRACIGRIGGGLA